MNQILSAVILFFSFGHLAWATADRLAAQIEARRLELALTATTALKLRQGEKRYSNLQAMALACEKAEAAQGIPWICFRTQAEAKKLDLVFLDTSELSRYEHMCLDRVAKVDRLQDLPPIEAAKALPLTCGQAVQERRKILTYKQNP